MLVDTNTWNTSTSIFGYEEPAPVGFAPVGINKIFYPQGEPSVAKAAGELGLPCYLSIAIPSPSNMSPPQNGENRLRFNQFYMPHDDKLAKSFLNRTLKSGFKAYILTVNA
ncbi:hypothetical protein CC78DRAFT_322149 [Lojkania enalia]|uniref:FMN hydroxy acid dehydrogenase domain-containing protein n=1 Tax=Lojkania enalia TaxID=147567 RepID=A0A9P4K458_9PLEO|nr:hypothetical protein CC78DRAFT_322149 [Didymosphaeria enalia]